jgi:general secretion pathway protein I
MKQNHASGFTLIEVLLALTVLAIALTALIKSTTQSVVGTARIKDKTISHWVAMQGISMIQLKLLTIPSNQEITKNTRMLGQQWYWRASIHPTPINHVQQIRITVSKTQSGPFVDDLIGYRYSP